MSGKPTADSGGNASSRTSYILAWRNRGREFGGNSQPEAAFPGTLSLQGETGTAPGAGHLKISASAPSPSSPGYPGKGTAGTGFSAGAPNRQRADPGAGNWKSTPVWRGAVPCRCAGCSRRARGQFSGIAEGRGGRPVGWNGAFRRDSSAYCRCDPTCLEGGR